MVFKRNGKNEYPLNDFASVSVAFETFLEAIFYLF